MKEGNVFVRWIQEKKQLAIFVIVIAVLLIVLSIFSKSCGAEIGTPTLLGDKEKVMLALGNTVADSKPVVDFFLKYAELTDKADYTIALDAEEGKEKSRFMFAHAKNGKQISYEVGSVGETKGKITAQIEAETLKLAYSNFENSVFLYHYKQENTGYIFTELLKPEEVEKFNESLEKIYQYGTTEDDAYEIAAASVGGMSQDKLTEYVAAYEALTFAKAYNRNYIVDEKEVLCAGYQTTITKEFLEKCGEASAFFKEGAQVTFYIYDNMLSAISIKEDGKTTELSFLGGNYRMQNLCLKEDGEVVVEMKIDTVTTEDDSLSLNGQIRLNEEAYKTKLSYDVWEYFLWADVESDADNKNENTWKDIELTIEKGALFTTLEGEETDIGMASVWEIGVTLLEIILEQIVEEME